MDERAFEVDLDGLVALGRALSDPIRVRMLSMLASGRECCSLPEDRVPEGGEGICICEFEDAFGLKQSKVSYHMKKLKDAGLVREERHGRWNYYSLDEESLKTLQREFRIVISAPATL